MESIETAGTVAEWLIDEELADCTFANLFLEDILKEFVQDMGKFQYSLNLLYEAQKGVESKFIGKNTISKKSYSDNTAN